MAKELSTMARWVSETRQRMIVVFEGRDTAGKGGSIDMFARLLNPRQCRVVALPSPSERERTQWYFQRYVEHLPAEGEIVLFDRSWYNRAGVERVMGFCTPDQAQDFLNAAPEFERHLVDDGILLFKYWLCCDQEIQEERFANRLHSPVKRSTSMISRSAGLRCCATCSTGCPTRSCRWPTSPGRRSIMSHRRSGMGS
jgi:polyphosphate kinase 2 (PPK2 family)